MRSLGMVDIVTIESLVRDFQRNENRIVPEFDLDIEVKEVKQPETKE